MVNDLINDGWEVTLDCKHFSILKKGKMKKIFDKEDERCIDI